MTSSSIWMKISPLLLIDEPCKQAKEMIFFFYLSKFQKSTTIWVKTINLLHVILMHTCQVHTHAQLVTVAELAV
ncbi:Os12g0572201 [Oryza sativa Japonica Group]|uniref:Os12g0572201 protein n=1 Tax=Oryza sativa subsp. japonica TaxID=39947 RepID=A0A0P0YC37_ORYSJ|nr:Os12g0572201 [Oryza sativa Japonica Group]